MYHTHLNDVRQMRGGARRPRLNWIPRAQDGFDFPAWRRVPGPARQQVTIGTTYDFLFTPPRAGNLALELRSGGGTLLVKQPIQVRKAGS